MEPLTLAVPAQFLLHVNYDCSLKQMIAAGRYDSTSQHITARNFRLRNKGSRTFKASIFRFGSDIPAQVFDGLVRAAGWEPGKIEHLLALGGKYPDAQKREVITAPGSVTRVKGRCHLPSLDSNVHDRGKRFLFLRMYDGVLAGACGHLVVRPD